MSAKMLRMDSNPCPHHPVTYTEIEVVAILKRRMALDPLNYRSTVLIQAC